MKKKIWLTLALAGVVQAAEIEPAALYRDISPDVYLRVPQHWTMLFADGARDPEALQPLWLAVQEKLALLPGGGSGISAEQKQVMDELFLYNNAPAELALYLNGGTPQVLFASRLAYRDEARFLAFVKAWTKAQGGKHQGDGESGRMTSLGEKEELQGAYRYDADTGQYYVLIGPQLPQTVDWDNIRSQPNDSLLAAAAQIDPQGGGLMVWIRNNPMMLGALSDKHGKWVKALQLLKLKSLSAGYGRDDGGKPVLQLNAEITPGGLRDFFPAQQPPAELAIHGEAQSAYAFTLPDSAGVQKILRIVEQGSGKSRLYADMKNTVQQELGLDIDVLLNAFGTQWTVLDDDFGQVFAVRKNDHWQPALDMLVKAGFLQLKPVGDTGMTHARLSFDRLYDKDPKFAELAQNPLVAAMIRAPSHFYFHEEGDYHVLAELPQPLLDRGRTKGGRHLGAYLHGAGQHEATLWGITRIEQLARRHYYSRLKWLQYLADLGGTDIDMAELPSAQMLNLPEQGYLQLVLDGDAQNLRLRFIFENSALDTFQHNGIYHSISGIAILGILSAVTLPAYQDYVERAQAQQKQQ